MHLDYALITYGSYHLSETERPFVTLQAPTTREKEKERERERLVLTLKTAIYLLLLLITLSSFPFLINQAMHLRQKYLQEDHPSNHPQAEAQMQVQVQRHI